MKKLLVITIALLLSACDKNEIDQSVNTQAPPFNAVPEKPVLPENPQQSAKPVNVELKVAAKRDTHSLMLTWSNIAADSFILCENSLNTKNHCEMMKQGSLSANEVALILGQDISLEQMLRNQLYINLFDKSNNLIGIAQIDINNDHINTMIQYFKATDASEQDNFGQSVSISGDGKTIAVGAYRRDLITGDQTVTDAGAVYIFNHTADGWEESNNILTYSAVKAHDQLGRQLSLSENGDVLAVSMIGYDTKDAKGNISVKNAGAVVLFHKKGNDWQESPLLLSTNITENLWFGRDGLSLSPNGETLAVSKAKQNQVELFVSKEEKQWQAFDTIRSTETEHMFRFAREMAFSYDGKMLVVGAAGDSAELLMQKTQDDETIHFTGAVYTYLREESRYKQIDYLQLEPAIKATYFGSSVDVNANGDILAVGAWNDSVYLYDLKENSWQLRATIADIDPSVTNVFGHKVRLSNDGSRLAVASRVSVKAPGINGDVIDAVTDTYGNTMLYDITSEPKLLFSLQSTDPKGTDNFGSALAFSGDGNTLAIGSGAESSGSQGINQEQTTTANKHSSGAVMVYHF